MKARGIGVAVHYIAAHLHPSHRDRWRVPLPQAEWASDSLLSLPLHPGISSLDVVRIATELALVASGV